MKLSLSTKLTLFVVLLFSAVTAVCLLWTPMKVKYYTAKLGSEDPKLFNDSVSKLMEMGAKGKDAIVRTARYKWEHMDTARRTIIINNLIRNQNECIELLTEVLEGGKNEANLLATHWADVNAGLIQWGSDPVRAASDTPIYIAVKSGWTDSVALLISRGAKVNVINRDIGTPLCIAAEIDSKAIVKLLIDKGADVDLAGKWFHNYTPLMSALRSGHEDIAAILINRGAKIDLKDRSGKSAIHFAAESALDRSIVFLIEKGADLNAKTNDGTTPLHKAVQWHRSNIASLLIEKGADVNARDNERKTPLHFVVMPESISIASLLIEKGADVNSIDHKGHTPLDKLGDTEHYRYLSEVYAALYKQGKIKAKDILDRKVEVYDLLRSHGAKTGEELRRSTEYQVPGTGEEKKE